jgi:hypothetical protein
MGPPAWLNVVGGNVHLGKPATTVREQLILLPVTTFL